MRKLTILVLAAVSTVAALTLGVARGQDRSTPDAQIHSEGRAVPDPVTEIARKRGAVANVHSRASVAAATVTRSDLVADDTTRLEGVCKTVALAQGGGSIGCRFLSGDADLDKDITGVTWLDGGRFMISSLLPAGAKDVEVSTPGGRPLAPEVVDGVVAIEVSRSELGTLRFRSANGDVTVRNLAKLTKDPAER